MNSCAFCHGSSFTCIKKQKNGWMITQCHTCGLVQISPKPTHKEIALLYKDDWSHFAPYISQTDAHRQYFSTLVTFLKPYLPHKKSIAVLDVGSATGVLLSVLQHHNMHGIGVDISHDAVSFCRKNTWEAYQGTLDDIVKKTKWKRKFDAVVACQVIEHEKDPALFFQLVKRTLLPRGIVIVTTPNHDSLWRKIMRNYWIGYQHPEHVFFYTPLTLTHFMEKAGLSVQEVRSDFPRHYSVSYAFQRLSAYLPAFVQVFRFLEYHTKRLHIPIPCNPWGDFLIVGKNQ